MIYFDNGATTYFKPIEVINAVTNTMKFLSCNSGRSGHTLAMRASMGLNATRAKMAKMFGLDTSHVIFTLNCTDALNMAIFGLRPTGHVITTMLEHNSVLRPLHYLQSIGQIRLTILEPNEDGIITESMVRSSLTTSTTLVVVTHVSNVTGAINDISQIGKLCKKNHIKFVVDGAQSCGYIDIDIEYSSIDMLAVACHKGLHAPQGVGCLLISKSINALQPLRHGGTGTLSASVIQPDILPESLESGTLPLPTIMGLNRAIDWCENNKIANRLLLHSLTAFALDNLRRMPNVRIYTAKNALSGIVSFNINSLDSMAVADILSSQYDIAVRAGLHCAPLIHKHLSTLETGIVRATFGSDNTLDEVKHLLLAVREISSKI